MKMERQMNFKEDCRKRTEKIEEILRKYLPDQTGHQQIIEEAMEYSLMAGVFHLPSDYIPSLLL